MIRDGATAAAKIGFALTTARIVDNKRFGWIGGRRRCDVLGQN